VHTLGVDFQDADALREALERMGPPRTAAAS
jgi:hypothetical protein